MNAAHGFRITSPAAGNRFRRQAALRVLGDLLVARLPVDLGDEHPLPTVALPERVDNLLDDRRRDLMLGQEQTAVDEQVGGHG